MISNKMFSMLDGRVIATHEVLGALISTLAARDPEIAQSLVDLLDQSEKDYADSREAAGNIRETINWLKDCLAHPPKTVE